MSDQKPRSVPHLLGDVIRGVQKLVTTEVKLFQTEVTAGLRQLVFALTLIILASIFAIAGLLTLLVSLVKGLAVFFHSEALSALVVGGAFAAVAIGFALVGSSWASVSGLEPSRTERQVRQDATMITERLEE
ncbi:phage holin family protein [Methylobacterium brachythecii]|uniref:phage holin family protein n=1 Tax=Methylobacterium brachythecii TaxID=1176177 RepID=UPI00160DF520|nr:phage holin family protein [Methylobacterium brachythecii]